MLSPGGQVHVGHRHVQAFDLAERVAELELGHVLPARQLGPAGFGGDRRNVQRRAAARAARVAMR